MADTQSLNEDRMKNYEQSYKRMWLDIERIRKQRDEAMKFLDLTRDLIIALEHDFGDGATKASIQTHDAFNRLRSRMADL